MINVLVGICVGVALVTLVRFVKVPAGEVLWAHMGVFVSALKKETSQPFKILFFISMLFLICIAFALVRSGGAFVPRVQTLESYVPRVKQLEAVVAASIPKLDELKQQMDNIKLTSGPQGIQGKPGAVGPQGIQGKPGVAPEMITDIQAQFTTLKEQNIAFRQQIAYQQQTIEENRYLLKQIRQLRKKIKELDPENKE